MEHVPEWLQSVIKTMQEKADAKYRTDVATYNAAGQDWTTAQVVARNTGRPYETEFKRPAPTRMVFGADENLNLTQTNVAGEVAPPVLPEPEPLGAAVPVSEWTRVGREQNAAQSDLLSAIFAKVSAIAIKVGA